MIEPCETTIKQNQNDIEQLKSQIDQLRSQMENSGDDVTLHESMHQITNDFESFIRWKN